MNRLHRFTGRVEYWTADSFAIGDPFLDCRATVEDLLAELYTRWPGAREMHSVQSALTEIEQLSCLLGREYRIIIGKGE
jgi:hypothetical protein